VTCKVETSRGFALAGIHPKAGGTGRELCSGDMLLEALIACAGASMRAAAAVLEIPIKSAEVSAEGDVDLRGTLGVTEGVPVGFKEIRLRFDVDSDASPDQFDQLIELTDRGLSDHPEQPQNQRGIEHGSALVTLVRISRALQMSGRHYECDRGASGGCGDFVMLRAF
jgi:uncharacterized OsmC-like protein